MVYRGEDTELNRQVAVKILHSFLADKEEARKRFQREARVVARLRHENILEIFDFSGLDSKDAFIVTEFIEGQTLATFLEDHPITVPEVAACILSQVCKAVIHAHGQGVIHRDIKPENIMIRKDGVIKLMDFGIAQMVDTQKLTLTGQLLGSPAYMAPEMVTGGPLDFRTDVFSLGVLLYRLATGQLPFTGNNPHEVLKKIADGDFLPASMSCPAVSEDLDTIIDKALTVEPENRYQSVAALDKALSGIISDLGRKDGTKETKEFFAHPDAYQKTLRKELVARLLAEAKAMGRARRLSTALRILNRILFLDEHNPEVPKLLDWIRRKQALGDFLRKIAQVSAVFLLIGVAGAAVWLFEQHSGSETALSKPVSAVALQDRDAATQTTREAQDASLSHRNQEAGLDLVPSRIPRDAAIPPERSGRGSRVPGRHQRSHPARQRETTREKRTFTLFAYPTSVKVKVDEGPARDYGPDTRNIHLGPGPHVIRLFSPYCYPRVIPIDAQRPSGVLRIRLKWRPALLTVKTNVPADIQAGGIIGLSSKIMRIPIPPDSLGGTTKVLVKASASGYHTVRRKVELRAGQPRTIALRLDPL